MAVSYPSRVVPAHADHYTKGRTHVIDTIVLHATGGRNSLAWLTWQSDPPVSVHCLVTKTGERIIMVADTDTAWHAGYGVLQLATQEKVNVNARSLGLELENLNDGTDPYPEAQLEAAAYHIALWHKAFPGVRLFRHRDIDSRKRDPAGLDMAAFHGRVWRHLCWLLSI